jgi:hypothetical protein
LGEPVAELIGASVDPRLGHPEAQRFAAIRFPSDGNKDFGDNKKALEAAGIPFFF